jgi:hypothetical protein
MPWQECCKMDERMRFVARLPRNHFDRALAQQVSSHKPSLLRCSLRERAGIPVRSLSGVFKRRRPL